MPEPVIIAVPPKGGSLDDVFKRLVNCGWLRQDLVTGIRHLIKQDKRRIKLEEGLASLWRSHGGDASATMRAADDAGHDLDEVEVTLARMRRYEDQDGAIQLGFSPKAAVDELLHEARVHADPVMREAAMTLHLELDLTRYGRPSRMMFDHLEFDWTGDGGRLVRGVLVGTEHEVTPTYLRRHKRDLSLTCYDAFHNTLLDALDTGKVHNWREMMDHLIAANTDVRILGSLGLDDYLGHFVLMPTALAEEVRALDGERAWRGSGDAKTRLLVDHMPLIDAQYEAIYKLLLDDAETGVQFECTTQDIEKACAEDGRTAIYIVRSGSTIACTPGLSVVGEPLVVSETIVAINQESVDHNPGIPRLIECLQPSSEDHSEKWRAALAKKLGNKLI